MIEVLNPPIRINCQDPELLLGRCMVSGVRVVEPDEALSLGYEKRVSILPTAPRQPTDIELRRIIATPETPPNQVMHLRRLPGHFVHRILGQAVASLPLNEDSPRLVVSPMVPSFYLGVTRTAGNQLSTTIDSQALHPVTGQASKVSMHIDSYRRERDRAALRLTGINLGRGPRYFCIAPQINRTQLGGPEARTTDDQAAYIKRAALDKDPAAVYWLRLDAPQPGPGYDGIDPQAYDAYTNAPVAWYSHDGSTLGLPQPSSIAFVMSRGTLPLDEYPSLLG